LHFETVAEILTLANTKSTIDTEIDIGRVAIGCSIVDWLQGPLAQPNVCAYLRGYKPSKSEKCDAWIQSRRRLQVALQHRQLNLHQHTFELDNVSST